jgi:hypothetical protein
MRKPFCMVLFLFLTGAAVIAGDIAVSVISGADSSLIQTANLTTNATTLSQFGADNPTRTAGGRETLRAFLKEDSVVFVHEWLHANGGPVDHGSTNRVILTNALPQTLTLGPWTATVFRVALRDNR